MNENLSNLLTRSRHEMSSDMREASWLLSSDQIGGGCVDEFVCDLGGEFYAIALFPWFADQHSAVLNLVGRIGLQYRPAQSLLDSFTGSSVSGLILQGTVEWVRISTGSDIQDAVRRLVEFACGQRSALEALTDIDGLIEMLRVYEAVPYARTMMSVYAKAPTERDGGEPGYPASEDELIPALFVSSGRYEQAQHLLDMSAIDDGSECASYHRQRFVRQLQRLIDARGNLDYPDTPPMWPIERMTHALGDDNREGMGDQIRQKIAEKQALAAVRAVRKNDTRYRLQLLLEAELEARHLRVSAIDVADMVNVLYAEQQWGGTLKLFGSVIKEASHLARSIINMSTAEFDEGEPLPPAWQALPYRAGYPIWVMDGEWVQVELADDAKEWLTRESRSSAHPRVRVREIMVWFAWEPAGGQELGTTQLAVHVGSMRVGWLRASCERHFIRPIEAATERDEEAWTRGRLTLWSSGQPPTLEVGIPPNMP